MIFLAFQTLYLQEFHSDGLRGDRLAGAFF